MTNGNSVAKVMSKVEVLKIYVFSFVVPVWFYFDIILFLLGKPGIS